jgi:type I restriction enzyme S subunit
MARFADVFLDVTKDGHKISKENYLPQGRYPIIDQGQEYIAGYSDESAGLYKDVPAIIFGDHTRIIKYVNTPCFLGADGVKLLKAKIPDSNYKYLYYALSHTQIPNTGYNRHFKWLKEVDIRLPSENEQQYIVEILDKLTNLISLRKQQLSKLDELVKARFVEMFGDPVSNSKGWSVFALKDMTSKIGSGATPKGGRESYQTEGITLIRSMNVHDGHFEYKDLAYINADQAEQLSNVEVYKNDVFINITGASVARSCIVPYDVLPARVNQHVSIIRCKQCDFDCIFANQQFLNESYKKKLLELGEAGGATRQAITKQQLEDLQVIVPPFPLQEQFSVFAKRITEQKLTIQQSLDKLEVLKKSLMQEYFG